MSVVTVAVVYTVWCCTLVDALCGKSIKVVTTYEALVSSSLETSGTELQPGTVQFHAELDVAFNGATDGVSLFAGSDNSTIHGVLAEEFRAAGGKFAGAIAPKESNTPTQQKIAQHTSFRSSHKGEYTYVLVVTTAQPDAVDSAILLLRDPESCVRAVFLQVVNASSSISYKDVYRYHTMAGAAVVAHQQHLLSLEALKRVLKAIKADAQWITCACTRSADNKECRQRGAKVKRGVSLFPSCALLVGEVDTADHYVRHLTTGGVHSKIDIQQVPVPPAIPGFIPPPPPSGAPTPPTLPTQPIAATNAGVVFVRSNGDDDSDDEDNNDSQQASNDPDGTDFSAAALLILAAISGLVCLGALGAALAFIFRSVSGGSSGGGGLSAGDPPDYGYDPSYASSSYGPSSQFSYF